MKNPVIFAEQIIKGKVLTYHLRHDGGSYYEHNMKSFNGKSILDIQATNKRIKEMIEKSEPFMVCRFGAVELSTVKTFDFELQSKYEGQLNRVHTSAGVFPETSEIGKRFTELMIQSISEADLIGIWPQPFEEYYLGKYGSETLQYTWLKYLEPWRNINAPWTAGLAGKKVLVIHPFSESIIRQYKRYKDIYPGTTILPEFSLDVMKSVQTSGGGEDERFQDWFQAYEWMKKEIRKRDFDIAILGCGAYGFPLAAEIKRMGKQAIHFGGSTQILFGIIGARWDNDEVVQKLKNDAWVRPLESERPSHAENVENACYW